MELRVVNLPDNSLAWTNCAFVSPADFSKLISEHGADPNEPFALLAGKVVYPLDKYNGLEDGTVALNSKQRICSGAGLGTSANVEAFNKTARSEEANLNILTAKVTVTSLHARRHAHVDADELEELFELGGAFFSSAPSNGAVYLLEQAGTPLALTFSDLKVAASGDDADGSDESGLVSVPFGVVTKLSTFVFVADPESKFLHLKEQAAHKSLLSPNFKFEDLGIGGLDKQFTDIFRRAFATRTFPPKVVEKLQIQHVKGLLLYGPPGTGKTLIARQIGKMLNGREPKVVNGPEILNKYVGQSEENIRKLFEDAEIDQAENGAKADLHIIIFDEIDAIVKQRGSVGGGTGVHDTVVNQLLSKMDGVNALNDILVIGMTNRKDLIDEALLRPGRFEVHMEIGLADEPGRLQILTIHTRRLRENNYLGDDVDLKDLAARTKNFSGAEIAGLVKSAMSFAIFGSGGLDVVGDAVNMATDLKDFKVSHECFERAIMEVVPAFGASEEVLERKVRNGIVEWGPAFTSVRETLRSLLMQVKRSSNTSLLSVLISGPNGTGKTALAAHAAISAGFPFTKIISPEDMVGYADAGKAGRITKVFEDAYKSDVSLIILDNIERLLRYVKLGRRFSESVLEVLLVLLKKEPPAGRRLMIIGTTSNPEVLEELEFLDHFNVHLKMPKLSTLEHFKEALAGSSLALESADHIDAIATATADNLLEGMGIKDLLMIVEMAQARAAHLSKETVDAEVFTACLREAGFA